MDDSEGPHAPDDRTALLQLKGSFINADSVLISSGGGWTEQDNSSVCDWAYVLCSDAKILEGFNFTGIELAGDALAVGLRIYVMLALMPVSTMGNDTGGIPLSS